jgi:hypothetical protein
MIITNNTISIAMTSQTNISHDRTLEFVWYWLSYFRTITTSIPYLFRYTIKFGPFLNGHVSGLMGIWHAIQWRHKLGNFKDVDHVANTKHPSHRVKWLATTLIRNLFLFNCCSAGKFLSTCSPSRWKLISRFELRYGNSTKHSSVVVVAWNVCGCYINLCV